MQRENHIHPAVVISLTTIALALAICASASGAVNTIHDFSGSPDGRDPASQLVFDSAGNAYGTTVTGGTSDCGTVFELTPDGQGHWTENVLFSFDCFATGKNPYGGVTLDAQGNLYGTTAAGGSGGVCVGDGCGVVYELTFSGGTWNENVLYSFGDAPDAAGPGSGVVFDRAGDLLGTAPDGGANGVGAIYELSPQNGQWSEHVVYDFTGGDDGGVGGLGLLLPDAYGNFYGITEIGGHFSAGTVFKLSPASGGGWQLTTLYAFQGQPDAGFPYGGLIADAHGNLYGTTYFGGANGAGAVYKVGPGPTVGPWRDSVLYSFTGGTDGGSPTSTLVFDAAGDLYGTTTAGGDSGCDCGVLFQLTASGGGWTESVIHTFGTFPDGAYPYYGLTPDEAGDYLSTTAAGGSENMGTVFEFTPTDSRPGLEKRQTWGARRLRPDLKREGRSSN